MKHYNFTNFLSKLEANKDIKFLQIISEPNPQYSIIYILIVFTSINKVLLKVSPDPLDNLKFNTEVIKIVYDKVFGFSNDNEYIDSDIDIILGDVQSFVSSSMINDYVYEYKSRKNSDFLKMIKEHLKRIEKSLI